MRTIDLEKIQERVRIARWLERERKHYGALYNDHDIIDLALTYIDPKYSEWLSRASHRRERFKLRGVRHADFIEKFSQVSTTRRVHY